MTKKQIIRCISFTLVACLMMILLCDLFEQENNQQFDQRYYTYKSLPENSVDAVFIGTSGVDRYWIGAKAYEEYGMSVYPLSIDEMPSFLYINVLKDAIKYQDPKLIMIDIRGFQQSHTADKMDTRARRVLDAMDFFSMNRLDAALRTMKLIHAADETKSEFDLSFLLSFIKYHSKWSEDSYRIEHNIGSRSHSYGGYYMNPNQTVTAKEISPEVQEEGVMKELDPVSEEALYELLEYIRSNDLNVLFVYTPRVDGINKTGQRNQITQILEEKGFDYVTFQLSDPEGANYVEFDYQKDFYDNGHVNYYGAEKFTAHFAKYLDEKYDLPDRRNDETAKAFWDGVYDHIVQKIKEYEESGLLEEIERSEELDELDED